MVYCKNEDQIADIMKKSLKPVHAVFKKPRIVLGVYILHEGSSEITKPVFEDI